MCMTQKLMQSQLKTLRRRVRTLESRLVPKESPIEKRKKLQAALKAVAGIWSDNPRTPADLKKLRKRLGYD